MLDKIHKRKWIGFFFLMGQSEFFQEEHFTGLHFIASLVQRADLSFVPVAIDSVPRLSVVLRFQELDSSKRPRPSISGSFGNHRVENAINRNNAVSEPASGAPDKLWILADIFPLEMIGAADNTIKMIMITFLAL